MFVSRPERARARTMSLGLVVLGCGPSVAVDSDAGTGTPDGTTHVGGSGAPSGTAIGDELTTAVDSTTGGTTGGGSGGITTATDNGTDTDTAEDTDGELWTCGPRSEAFGAAVSFDVGLDLDAVSIDAVCTIDEILARDRWHTAHVLSCDEAGVTVVRTIEIYADPPVESGLAPGDTVGVRLERELGIDTPGIEHVAIRDADGELVAAMYGSLDEPDGFAPDVWFQPFSFMLTIDVCRPEPYEPPPGGSFIVDPCPDQMERGAFIVASPAGEALVYEGTRAMLGEHDVRVVFARHVIPQEDECGDAYDVGRIVLLRDG